MSAFNSADKLMRQQFGHDVSIALATSAGDQASVRIVDGYYKDGCFYVTSYALSRKMQEIAGNPKVSVCCNLMQGFGIGENLGNPKEERNRELARELREVFIAFYDRHVNEDDPNTCILKIRLTKAVAFSNDTKYIIDFENRSAEAIPFVNDIVAAG